MLFNYSFPQGVDDVLAGTYVRAISSSGAGMLVMNTETGATSRKFVGLHVLTLSFEDADTIVGVAYDSAGAFLYRATLSTNHATRLGYVPQLGVNGHYSVPQGDYDYDPASHTLYMSAFHFSHSGMLKFTIDGSPKGSFVAEWKPFVTIVDGKPVGLEVVPQHYGVPQGVSAYDPKTKSLYLPAEFDPDYETPDDEKAGILKAEYNGSKFVVVKFIEVDSSLSNLAYDPVLGKFLGERFTLHGIELFAVDIAGDVFRMGTAVSTTFLGTDEDDFYLALGGNDQVIGFAGDDSLDGGVGNDTLFGDAKTSESQAHNATLATAASGNDVLVGGAGNDKIFGGAGVDRIIGGLGRDALTGGLGKDTFDFNSVKDMGTTAKTRDVIVDFSHGQGDRIDLSTIDGTGKAAGHSFHFIGTKAFDGSKGALHYRFEGSTKTIVEGDIDGDKHADFQIEIAAHKGLTAVDFSL